MLVGEKPSLRQALHEFEKAILALGLVLGTASGISPAAEAAEDARVLPRGRTQLQVVHARTSGITDVFNSAGEVQSVTAPYNLELSSKNLQAAVPEIRSLIQGLNDQFKNFRYNPDKRDNGYHGITTDPGDLRLGDALSRGFLHVGAEAKQYQTQVGVMHGITDRLSLGFMIPIVRNEVKVTHSLDGLNTAEDIYNGIKTNGTANRDQATVLDDLRKYLNDLRSANDETLQRMLVSKGYDRFADSDKSGLGDIVFGGRYLYMDISRPAGQWLASSQAGFTAPTGKTRPPKALTELDFGQGCWDLGVANMVNYLPSRTFMFSQGIHYTRRFASSRVMRVRSDPTDAIPDADDEEEVSMHLGDKLWFTVGGQMRLFNEAFTLDFGYEWFWKAQDTYQGYRNRDYTHLSNETPQYQETLSVGASLSTIPYFKRYGLRDLLPGDLSLTGYMPLRGRNIPIAPYALAKLALYF